MVDLLVGERSYEAAFCGLRPPGHHAERARAMGFCLFNNVAVAARRARDAHGVERVLVLDWDVHHGNGTNAIFHEDPGVLFVSIHQWPLYPGTGPADDVGSGRGAASPSTFPCRRARATRLSHRTSSTSWARWCGITGRASSSSRRATTHIATIRSRTAR